MRAQATSVAARYADAQRWWIASQLVARNPDLQMHLQVDLIDGEALVLTMPNTTTMPAEIGARLRIVLDRQGVKLIAPVVFAPLLWAEVLSFATPLEAVFRIETSLGLTPLVSQDQALPSRPLAYTVLALLLAARVHDTDGWDVRSLNPQLLGVDDWGPADLTSFPSLTEAMINVFELEVARGIVPAACPVGCFTEASRQRLRSMRLAEFMSMASRSRCGRSITTMDAT